MIFEHKSVLLYELVESLNIKEDGIYVDGTLGGAGHSSEILKKLSTGKLIGIDQDKDAIEFATKRLLETGKNNFIVVRDNYCNIASILKEQNIDKVDGICLDLGVSSYQLDTVERGFSYRFDAKLDMRMDDRISMTAKDIVNEYSEVDLYRIIRDYGEDRFAKNIAKHIVKNRQVKPIETTFELSDIIKAAIPMKVQVTGGHPSKRTFQAIRIELNKELKVLEDSIDIMIDFLKPGARLSIISFHSLEDRIVKNIFRRNENPKLENPELLNLPFDLPGFEARGRIVTKKGILPSVEELEENSRSRSARLRVFEKL